MIKKLMSFIFVLLLISGCGMALDNNDADPKDNENKEGEVQLPNDSENPSDAFSNEYKTILMENVDSSDILLFEKFAFTSLEFNVRDKLSYVVGKEYYRIGFLSNAEPEDIYDAYIAYLDEVSEEHANEYKRSIEGTIDNRPIAVDVVLSKNENRGGYVVTIRISEEASKFQDENPYFNEYPDLVDLYEVNNEPHYYYKERYDENYKEYFITYSTSASVDDFVDYFNDNYSQKSNFELEEDEFQKRFSWIDSGFEHKVNFQISNNMVGVYVKTTLPWVRILLFL